MTDSRRYHSQEHLDLWRSKEAFPKIHTPLFKLIAEKAKGRRFCDLCCSTGLLGQRLISRKLFPPAEVVIGIEADPDAIARAKAAGVTMPIHGLTIAANSLPLLGALLKQNQINVLVARRCISEILGFDRPLWEPFVETVAGAGIVEVYLQGRQADRRAVHPMPSVDHEIEPFLSHYRLTYKRGQLARLVRNG